MAKKTNSKPSDRRRHIAFSEADIPACYEQAIRKGVIWGRNFSHRAEILIMRDIKQHLPGIERAGIAIPAAVSES